VPTCGAGPTEPASPSSAARPSGSGGPRDGLSRPPRGPSDRLGRRVGPPRAAWHPPAWAICLAFAVLVFYAYGMGFIWGGYQFLDLRVYMGAAGQLLSGHNPYALPFTATELYATYPPFALIVLSPLSLVPVHVTVYLWSLANLACLALLFSLALAELKPTFWGRTSTSKRLVLCSLLALAAVITLQPVRSNFGFGQVNIVLIMMVALDVLKRGLRARGALVGLAGAVKFTPLIFVVVLALERDWRAVRRSVASFCAATGLAWLLAPGPSADYFFHFRLMEQRIGTPTYVSNQSLNGVIARLSIAAPISTLAWAALSLVVVVAAALVARRLVDRGQASLMPMLAMATAGLLISPISWDHHWSWVALFPFALLDRSLPTPVRAALIAVVTVAVAAPYWWGSYGIYTGALSPLADDSLAVVGVGFLVSWAWVLRGEISLKDLSWSALFTNCAPGRGQLRPGWGDRGYGAGSPLSEPSPAYPPAPGALRPPSGEPPWRGARGGAGTPAPREAAPSNGQSSARRSRSPR
jgi:alpha-1,2-mannosyltransferase